MTGSDKITFAQLLDWFEGRLSADEAREVAARLAEAGDATQADLAWLQEFQHAREQVKLAAPPTSVRAELKRRFSAYAEKRQSPGFFRRILAQLTFDSRSQWAPAGVRSAAAEGQQLQLIYTTEQLELALNIWRRPQDNTLEVSGQIFPATGIAPPVFSIQLLQADSPVQTVTSDELGEFTLLAVQPGDYELVVSADDFEVVIPAISMQL